LCLNEIKKQAKEKKTGRVEIADEASKYQLNTLAMHSNLILSDFDRSVESW